MQWAATDQFGNLYMGESGAKTLAELRPDLESLVDELCARTPDPVRISVDIDYAEMNGPDPEQVSHVLLVPGLEAFHSDQAPAAILAEIAEAVNQICAERGIDRITVELA